MPYKVDHYQAMAVTIFAAIAAYFDSTLSFLCALLLAFAFNIIAGFRADEVKVVIKRIFPPIYFENFHGNKLKDSLMELVLITSVTYLLKGLTELLKYEESSYYIVQFLIAVAVYYYFRNGLRNLKNVYPNNKWLAMLYHLISFKFRALVGDDVADIIDKEERRKNTRKAVKRSIKKVSDVIDESKEKIDELKDNL